MTLLSAPVPFASHLARSCRGWGHRGELLASFGGRLGSEGSGPRAAQGTVKGRCPLAGESARGPLPSFLLGFCSSRVMDRGMCAEGYFRNPSAEAYGPGLMLTLRPVLGQGVHGQGMGG